MTNEIATKSTNDITYSTWGEETVTLNEASVRNITNNNTAITKGEIALFIENCKYMRLNPFTKQIYLVKYDSTKPAQTIVSRGAMKSIAEENPQYDGIESGVIALDPKTGDIQDRIGSIIKPNETLYGGWAKVYRKDRRVPFTARIALKEYNKGKSLWISMPMTMITKCAEANALRSAFPIQMSGMYTEEEMGMEKVEAPVYNASETETKVARPTESPKTYDIVIEDVAENICETDVENADFAPATEVQFDKDYVDDDTIPESENADFDYSTVDDSAPQTDNIVASPQQSTKRISYSEYRDNKSQYRAVYNSYDANTKTIEVYC